MKAGLPLMKNVLTSLARVKINVAASKTDASIHQRMKWKKWKRRNGRFHENS